MTVQDGFAFTVVTPRTAAGGKIDYSQTRFRNEELDGGLDASLYALLRQTDGEWRVLAHVLGPTDVAYSTWWSEFGAPKTIFPYTE